MQIIRNINDMKKEIKKLSNKSVGFVPTMGALHLGHISLIQKAKIQNDIVVVSIFVNPKQFDKSEDLTTYPRKEEADIESCKRANCDILFIPNTNDIYKNTGEIQVKSPFIKGYILEGASRSGHFDGVMQILVKLFNIILPTRVYFGKKDAQQLIIVKQFISDLFFDIDIVECDTIRDVDGLALSSRNVYLDANSRQKALGISKALSVAYKKIQQGHISSDYLIQEMKDCLRHASVDYIEIVDRDLNVIQEIQLHNSILLIALIINKKRYIDNLWV